MYLVCDGGKLKTMVFNAARTAAVVGSPLKHTPSSPRSSTEGNLPQGIHHLVERSLGGRKSADIDHCTG